MSEYQVTGASIANLAAALVRAQGELKNPAFDAKNPHFKSQFASLSAVRAAVVPVLAKHGIWVSQDLTSTDAGVACTTLLLHSSGESLRFGPLFLPAAKLDPQGFGSAATYARRYSLMAACGVVGDEDDDANAATKAHQANGAHPPLPTHAEAIRAHLDHSRTDAAVQIFSGLTRDEKRAVWAQLSKAEQERIKVFQPRESKQTEVVQ